MPCHTRQYASVDLGKLDPDLLMKALTEMGLKPVRNGDIIGFGLKEYYNISTGKLMLGLRYSVNEIKRAYSAEIVKTQAKRFGWQIKKTAENKYVAIKGR